MASQRIVLTSPWKLGLFVFLLVVGCGFGLVFAYLRYFGGTLDFNDEQSLRAFYIVCGSVAGLGLLGYLSVVASSRPMDGMGRGSRKRDRLLKKFAKIKDPEDCNPDDYSDEPALARVLERWLDQSRQLSGIQTAAQSQREAIASLTRQLQHGGGAPLDPESESEELAPLVESINQLVREQQHSEPAAPKRAAPARVDDSQWTRRLVDARQQLLGFAQSVAESSEHLRRRAQSSMSASGAHPTHGQHTAAGALQRASQRLSQNRALLEQLAEESNRLAIQAALQVSRVGEPASELMQVTEDIRQLSTRYQRLASEFRLCEGDQELAQREWNELASNGSAPSGEGIGLEAGAVQQVAMILDQNAGGLEELAAALVRGIEGASEVEAAPTPKRPQSRAIEFEAPAAKPSAPISRPVSARVSRPVSRPVALSGVHDLPLEPEMAASPNVMPDEEVYDLSDFDAHELDESGEPIYDLKEFDAVEL